MGDPRCCPLEPGGWCLRDCELDGPCAQVKSLEQQGVGFGTMKIPPGEVVTSGLEWDGFRTGTKRFAPGEGVNQTAPLSVAELDDPFKLAEFLLRHEGDKVQLSRDEYYRIIRGMYEYCSYLESLVWDNPQGVPSDKCPLRRTKKKGDMPWQPKG